MVWVPESQLKKTCWVWDNPGSAKQATIFAASLALPLEYLRAASSPGTKSWVNSFQTPVKSSLPPWWQQLSTDSSDFSSSTQPMESWSLSHVHLDRSGLAAPLTAQLSRVPTSPFGRRQHILGGAGRRTRTANLPFWRSCGLMKSCQPSRATLSAVPCHCQAVLTPEPCLTGWDAQPEMPL